MSQFEHSVKISDAIVRKFPWGWLHEQVGSRIETWDVGWKGDLDSPIETIVCFKNKEDAAKFVLTWC